MTILLEDVSEGTPKPGTRGCPTHSQRIRSKKGGLGWLMIDCGTRYPGGHLWLAFSSSPAEGTSSGVLW